MGVKVLHIIDNMSVGGAQRIVSSLIQNNPDHKLHALRDSKEVLGDVGDFSKTKSPWRFNMRSFLDVCILIDRENPDVVHCHLKKSVFIGIAAKLASRRKFRLVVHEHGEIWKGNKNYNRILSLTSPVIDKHVAVSSATADLLRLRGSIPEENIEVIYNFVDQKRFNPNILEKFTDELQLTSDDKFTIGFGGRLIERKGWRTIVSLASKLDTKNYRVIMTGSGEGRSELNQISKEIENLHYLGYIEDIRALFANIDCFVLPSEWDPSPMILYEVQSCGLPLICADVPAINELVDEGQNSLMYSYDSTSELIDRVNEIANNQRLREKLRDKGIENSMNFTYEKYEASLENMYINMLKN